MELAALFQRIGGVRPAFGDAFLSLTEDEIANIEREVGHGLPSLYREFLNKYGASRFRTLMLFKPARRLPPTISKAGWDYISSLYGKEPKGRTMCDLLVRLRYYRGRMPDSIIPVGDNGLGNQICIGVSGEASGKIFYWDRNNEFDEDEYLEDHEPPVPRDLLWQNVHPIADSFEDFLQRLEIDPEE